eukprot:Phypoly_transcript_07349.p1 GENE.Phypoly_transcript_07349~~Phypoly_transcript_07349.p1  ORF type:complete len:264 (+),score=66.20 Phypoly_transcript_07349:21-812(+)
MEELEAACNALLGVALSAKIGATPVPEDPYLSKLQYAEQLKIWLQHEARLKAEIAEYQTAIMKGESANRPDEKIYQDMKDQIWTQEKILECDDRLQDIIVEHQAELFREVSKNQREELIVHRILSAPIILESLYPSHRSTDASAPSPLLPLIKDAQLARDAAMPALMDLAKRLTRTQEEIAKTRTESNRLRDSNKLLWRTLQLEAEKQEPLAPDEIKKQEQVKERIKEKKAQTTILRSIFQALIIESGTNWAKDPELREFMTS